MNPAVGWFLVVAALVSGYWGGGWGGVVLAITVIVFWLLLQASRTLRVMRGAAQTPVGYVPSAVMLHAKLHAGMRLIEVTALTRSLGKLTSPQGTVPETFTWADENGDSVEASFAGGQLQSWVLHRKQVEAVDTDRPVG